MAAGAFLRTPLCLTRHAVSRAPRRTSCPLALTRQSSTVSTGSRAIAALFKSRDAAEVSDVQVDGFVRSVRAQKRHTFVSLGDGSSLAALQAVVPAELAEGLSIGAAVRLQGTWAQSPGKGQSHELQVTRADILGPSDAKTFPVQKKYQTPEYLRTIPHMRPRIPFNATVLRFRSELISSLTRFFESRSFIQTHTPISTSSDCEGAGEVFRMATPGDNDGSPFFRRPVYSTVSGQLHLEALSQSLGDVWTLSPTFRAEHSDTPRHLSEFYMLEAEMSFVDRIDGIMDLVEDMIRHVSVGMQSTRTFEELTTVEHRSEHLEPVEKVRQRWEGLQSSTRWARITYTEAIKLLQDAAGSVTFEHKPVWGQDLHTEHERHIANAVGNGSPVFVTHYPRDIKAFYMKTTPADGSESPVGSGQTVECFDLLVPDFCEIVGGSMREHRYDELLRAMSAKGIAPSSSSASTTGQDPASMGQEQTVTDAVNDLQWYLDLRRWGCPPHGGFGLGFDRLLCYLTGVQTIRDTTAFPRWYGRCDC